MSAHKALARPRRFTIRTGAAVAALVFAGAGAAVFFGAQTASASGRLLMVSHSPDRSDFVQVAGSSLSGNVPLRTRSTSM